MTYQLTPGEMILRLSDNAFIPPDPANTDYQAFLAWVAEGNEPLPYIEPEKLPEPSFKDKLAAVGITIEDLKVELGLAEAAPAVSEPAPVEPTWSAMTKAEIAAYCQDTFGETLDTSQLKDELIARAHELWVVAYG